MTKQPVLTGFPRTVFATAARRAQALVRAARERLITDSLCGYALIFESVLPAAFLSGINPTKRERHFGHLPVFWAWLSQILEANARCTKAVSMILTSRWVTKTGPEKKPLSSSSPICLTR